MGKHIVESMTLLFVFSLLIPVLTSAQTMDDFSDPLLALFKELTPETTIAQINTALGRYAPANRIWKIEEPGAWKRNSIWDASFEYFVPNVFTTGEYIRSVLYIYFQGAAVECIFYRYWGDHYYEPLRKGRSCAELDY